MLLVLLLWRTPIQDTGWQLLREPGQNGEVVGLDTNGNGERNASLDVMHTVMTHGRLRR